MRHQIHDRKRVIRTRAVVRHIGGLAIAGSDDFVGIIADRYPRDPSSLAAYIQMVNSYCALGKVAV